MGEINELFAGNDAIGTLERRLRAYRVCGTDADHRQCEHGCPYPATNAD
jgi:hypothetical protein